MSATMLPMLSILPTTEASRTSLSVWLRSTKTATEASCTSLSEI